MNRFEGPGSREAKIRYLDGDFQVLSPGAYVPVRRDWGEDTPLDELRYWSVARQEALCGCAHTSLEREVAGRCLTCASGTKA